MHRCASSVCHVSLLCGQAEVKRAGVPTIKGGVCVSTVAPVPRSSESSRLQQVSRLRTPVGVAPPVQRLMCPWYPGRRWGSDGDTGAAFTDVEARRRACKSVVERDRCLRAEEVRRGVVAAGGSTPCHFWTPMRCHAGGVLDCDDSNVPNRCLTEERHYHWDAN